jgi:hypothetical protein
MTNSNIETPSFITALKTGGTKEEAIFALERMWEELEKLEKFVISVREILDECQDDFHRCSKCDHQDDDATKNSDLFLLLKGSLETTASSLLLATKP